MGRKIPYELPKQGDVFNNWKVVEYLGMYPVSPTRNSRMCECECLKCGRLYKITTAHLVYGTSKQCNRCSSKKFNQWESQDDCHTGTTSKGDKFLIDLDKVLYHSLYLKCWFSDSDGYLKCVEGRVNNKKIYSKLHNVVWEFYNGRIPDNYIIDHINGNPKDNRLSNLRLVTLHQNTLNRKTTKKNTSGHAGVCLQHGKWSAYITYKGKKEQLGYFDDKEEAIKARLKRELELFGKYSRNYKTEEKINGNI